MRKNPTDEAKGLHVGGSIINTASFVARYWELQLPSWLVRRLSKSFYFWLLSGWICSDTRVEGNIVFFH